MSQNNSFKQLLNFSIINIDKPTGPTSFTVSNFVRKELGLSKTSHMGTLDPIVTGVLPVTLGRACRLSKYLMGSDKEYVGIMRIHEETSEKKLKEEINKFVGKIIQLPPVRSSVKRAERVREIKSFEILEISGKDVLFKTTVQAGTYVRKLIHDLGEKIGGAHMLELRRTRAGIFTEEKIFTLYEFESAVKEFKEGRDSSLKSMLVSAEEAICKILPKVNLKSKNLKNYLTGKPLFVNDFLLKIPEEETFIAFSDDLFVGVYHKVVEGEILARPEFIYN